MSEMIGIDREKSAIHWQKLAIEERDKRISTLEARLKVTTEALKQINQIDVWRGRAWRKAMLYTRDIVKQALAESGD